jgi:hypothetical protein
MELRRDTTVMNMTDLKFGLWLAILPATVFANPYDGVYKQTANAECGLIGVDGGSLKIEDNIFYGVEVECLMTNPVDVDQMDATLYEMQCSGEGETWAERAMLMPDAENTGIYMIWSGYAFRYDQCEDPGS